MPLIETPPDALAEIYAKSLYQLADEQGGRTQVEAVLSELEQLLELARADKRFSEFLASRVVPASLRGGSLEKILKGRCSDLTLRFLRVLNDKNRLGHLPAIAGALDRLVQEKFGRVEVDAYTAQALGPEETSALRDQLRAKLGREPVLHAYVDPSMIGGLRLQIGDQLIDGSVSTQLRRLRQQFSEKGAATMRTKFDRTVEG
jgi:F-type H+-transporting ATPase subunit delta